MTERIQAAKAARQRVIDAAISDAFDAHCLPKTVHAEADGSIEIYYRNGMIFKGYWLPNSEHARYVGRWQPIDPRYRA